MKANDLIRSYRSLLGMSEEDVASTAGLTAHEYHDVESHDDEIFTTVATGRARALCGVLNLPLQLLVEADPLNAAWGVDRLERSDGLLQRRKALALTVPQLADLLGFEDEVVEKAEADANYLESLPLDVLATWARSLDTPLGALLELNSSP